MPNPDVGNQLKYKNYLDSRYMHHSIEPFVSTRLMDLRKFIKGQWQEWIPRQQQEKFYRDVMSTLDKYDSDGFRKPEFFPDPRHPQQQVDPIYDTDVTYDVTKPARVGALRLADKQCDQLLISDLCRIDYQTLDHAHRVGRSALWDIALLLWNRRILWKAMPENVIEDLKATAPDVTWAPEFGRNPLHNASEY